MFLPELDYFQNISITSAFTSYNEHHFCTANNLSCLSWCSNNRNYVEVHSTFCKLQLNFAKMFILTESLLIQSYDSDEKTLTCPKTDFSCYYKYFSWEKLIFKLFVLKGTFFTWHLSLIDVNSTFQLTWTKSLKDK